MSSGILKKIEGITCRILFEIVSIALYIAVFYDKSFSGSIYSVLYSFLKNKKDFTRRHKGSVYIDLFSLC